MSSTARPCPTTPPPSGYAGPLDPRRSRHPALSVPLLLDGQQVGTAQPPADSWRQTAVGAGRDNCCVKPRRLRDGDVLDDGETVLVRGGVLDPGVLRARLGADTLGPPITTSGGRPERHAGRSRSSRRVTRSRTLWVLGWER